MDGSIAVLEPSHSNLTTEMRAAAVGRRQRVGKAAPSQGALRALLSNPSNPRPPCQHLTNWGDVDVEDPQPDGAHKPKPTTAPGTREGGRVCVVLTRALENRGPEEFTLRTASGGENNQKQKNRGRVGRFPNKSTKTV